jgi:hypothetical protein
MAARDKSKRGLEILEQCMEDTTCDWNTRLKAVELLWERGYGRPQVSVDVNTTHNFCIAPDVMELGVWLERRGQPIGEPGDAWLAQQRRVAAPTEKRSSDAPGTQAGASSGPPTIDAVAEDALLLDKDPTAPAPDKTKLN